MSAASNVPSKESVKETIISVIIAFAMAFVFRSFVAEAFIIPTGSMAPTLNGAHMRFVSPQTGQDWAVGPWYNIDNNSQNPYPNQGDVARRNYLNAPGANVPGVIVHDPATGLEVVDRDARARAGDRIFVLKYLYGIQSPDPFDVVVFKNPTNPDENYIKRLIGLPGEQIALVDGDVFYRTAPKEGAAKEANPWEGTDWKIRRKPADAQRAVWQPVFDSSLMTKAIVNLGVTSPWVARGATVDEASSRYVTTAAPATIAWDRTKQFVARQTNGLNTSEADRTREINDRYAYNEGPYVMSNRPHFPVGDVRLRATVMVNEGADASALSLSGVVEARGHEFRVTVAQGKAVLSMRPLEGGEAKVLAEAPVSGVLGAGKAVPVEFWHSDQQLQLWMNGKLVVSGGYDWLPMMRLQHALTGAAWDQFTGKTPTRSTSILADPASYRSSGARWEASGAALELRSVALDRDLYYRPAYYERSTNNVPKALVNQPAAATHPSSTLTLGADQFFVCGDNSPQSLDARLWGYPDPWVAEEIDASPSVVSRRLLMGKAFFVYFPAPVGGSPVSVPDFGRLRAIR